MSLDTLLEDVRTLSTPVIAAIGALAAVLVVLAIALVAANRRLRRDLAIAQRELVDERTGLLPRSAIRVRLGAELAWAAASRTPLAVVALHIRGSRFRHAARALRRAMREEEAAFLHDRQHVVVELWDADPDTAVEATRRLGAELARAGHPVVDAGIACAPRDGSDVQSLVTIARRDLRPIDDPIAPGRDLDRTGRARPRAAHVTAHAAQVLGWLVTALVLLATTWNLLPAAIEPLLTADAARTGEQLAIALITTIGLPVGAALLLASAWNQQRGRVPRSRPLARIGVRTSALVTLLVAAPLAWAIHAPLEPAQIRDAFGGTLVVTALLVLTLTHARQLVHLPTLLLLVLAAAGGATAWCATDIEPLPTLVVIGQLVLITSLAAIITRRIERASWLLAIAVVSAAISSWAATLDVGLLEWTVGEQGADALSVPGLEQLAGPSLAGTPLLVTSLTSLLLLAIGVCWLHDWRVDLRWGVGALLASVWSWAIVQELAAVELPLTPWIGGALVLLLIGRSLLLRGRVSATDVDPPADEAPNAG